MDVPGSGSEPFSKAGGGLERHRLHTEYVSIMSWDDGIRCGP